jgi:hypothetical protein
LLPITLLGQFIIINFIKLQVELTQYPNTHRAIQVTSGNGYTISNNVIGYASNTATGIYTMLGTIATRFIAIDLAVGTTVATSVQNNTVSSISLNTSSGAATANGVLCGLNITAGNVNVGNITPNTFGVLHLRLIPFQ